MTERSETRLGGRTSVEKKPATASAAPHRPVSGHVPAAVWVRAQCAWCTSAMPAVARLTAFRSSLTKLLVAPSAARHSLCYRPPQAVRQQLLVQMVSPLEKERNERVASNKRRLEELGIQEAAAQLKAAPAAR